MSEYTVYALETGSILRSGFCRDDDVNLQVQSLEEAVLPVRGNDAIQYVLDGELAFRPTNTATLFGNTLSNLPNPCTIVINNSSYVCDSDTAELEFDQPGIYRIKVKAFPYLDSEFTVTV